MLSDIPSSCDLSGLVEYNVQRYRKNFEKFQSQMNGALHDEISSVLSRNEKDFSDHRHSIERRSEIFANTLKNTIEIELKKYHQNVVNHIENANDLEKIDLITFFEGIKNILINLFGESFRSLIENDDLNKELNRVWTLKISKFNESLKKKNSLELLQPAATNSPETASDTKSTAGAYKPTAFDDDNEDVFGKKPSTPLRSGASVAKTDQNMHSSVTDKGKEKSLPNSGIFNKVKRMFGRKKQEPEPDGATPIHLGDNKKFYYDPDKKKYIFEGEEDVAEEEAPAMPPKMGKKEENPAAGGENSQSKPEPTAAAVEDKKPSATSDLTKPPPSRFLGKKKDSKKEPKANPTNFTMFKPTNRDDNEDSKVDLSQSVSVIESENPVKWGGFNGEAGDNKMILRTQGGIVEEFRKDIVHMVNKFKVNLDFEDFKGVSEMLKKIMLLEIVNSIENKSLVEVNNSIHVNLFEGSYKLEMDNYRLKKISQQYNTKLKEALLKLENREEKIEENVFELLHGLKSVGENFGDGGVEFNLINMHYKGLELNNEILKKLLDSLTRCEKLEDRNCSLEEEAEAWKAKYQAVRERFDGSLKVAQVTKEILENYQIMIREKDRLLINLKEENYQLQVASLESMREMAILKIELQQKDEQLAEALVKIQKNEEVVSYQREQHDENLKKANLQVREYENRSKMLEDAIDSLNETVSQLQSRINELQSTSSELSDANKNLQSSCNELQESVNELKNNINQINQNNDEKSSQLEQYVKIYDEIDQKYRELENQYNSDKYYYEEQLKSSADTIESYREKCTAIENELQNYTNHNYVLISKNEAKSKVIDELNQKIDVLTNDLEMSTNELKRIQNKQNTINLGYSEIIKKIQAGFHEIPFEASRKILDEINDRSVNLEDEQILNRMLPQ